MKGVERYFFDSYYRRVDESSSKELKLSGGRNLKKDEYHALEGRFDKLGKGIGPQPLANRGKGPLMLARSSAKAGPDPMMVELEKTQIPIVAALKDDAQQRVKLTLA